MLYTNKKLKRKKKKFVFCLDKSAKSRKILPGLLKVNMQNQWFAEANLSVFFKSTCLVHFLDKGESIHTMVITRRKYILVDIN